MNSPVRITNQTWPDSTTPVVSVFNWVYNHKDFIRESIEGILMQETTFPVEIIIQDDASNDGTREIIEEYQEKFPQLFNNILFSENQYSQGKSIMNGLFEKPRGKYIALAHGDDYWTDPLKLQKQVDILNNDESINVVSHNVNRIGLRYNDIIPNLESKVLNLDNILFDKEWNFIPTATILYRKDVLNDRPNWFNYIEFEDWPILVQLCITGNLYFMKDLMGAYNKHINGYTEIYGDTMQLKLSNFYHVVGIIFPDKFHECSIKMKSLEKKIIINEKRILSFDNLIKKLSVFTIFKLFTYKLTYKLLGK
jgi:glycosyltransferase involved in cell wall biosynthesis